MSNFTDIVVYFAGLGDACPTVAAVQAALAASAPSFAKQGDVIYPGVTLVDADNGLVHIDALDAKAPGQAFGAIPTKLRLDPGSKAVAGIEWNCAAAQRGDEGVWMYNRFMEMAKQDSSSRPYVADGKWLPNAWSVGAEFTDWPGVIDHLLNHWTLPK